MSRAEFQPVALQDYGVLLMEALDGIEYEDAELGDFDLFTKIGIRTTSLKERSKSEFDAREAIWWTLTDRLRETERFGETATNRLVVLEKETDDGTAHIRLWDSIQKISVMAVNYELPSDFSPRDEFIQGLKTLAEGKQS